MYPPNTYTPTKAFSSYYGVSQYKVIIFTPGDIRVSTEHVDSDFDDSYSVCFSIAPAMEGTGSPAVDGGAVTQQPLRIIPHSRREELCEISNVVFVF